jgi:leucyl aminopeptidase (aminopeptidase T)
MSESLTGEELTALIERVFQPGPGDHAVAVLIDLPDAQVADSPRWRERRAMAADWAARLAALEPQTGRSTHLVLYRNVRMNNADLPATAWLHTGPMPSDADALDPAKAVPFPEVLRTHPIVIAVTQFSATAPLKLMARTHGFRAATMPGFSEAMIPALRLDYTEINRRVNLLKDLLDRAALARFVFRVDGAREHRLQLDLRHRIAHASGGLIPQPGTAGNLPSGEAYVVPYEGEREDDPSRSEGELPVELGDEVVVYRIEHNRAVGLAMPASGDAGRSEAEKLVREPAYGNLAELGLGVLGDFGVQPAGEVLLDEKLGLHIAFGRSDHFGGQVGARQFSSPEAVVHIDRVYVPSLQPRVQVARIDLELEDGSSVALMRDGRYAIAF